MIAAIILSLALLAALLLGWEAIAEGKRQTDRMIDIAFRGDDA